MSRQRTNAQHRLWKSSFGDEYVKRNFYTPRRLDAVYERQYGVTRRRMDREFLATIPRSARILEVGANFGMQLATLQEMGFTNLYGLELNARALEIGRKKFKGINFIEGNALDIPFKDGYFDVVFTSGVLIHVAPKDRSTAMREIYRCSRKYIWGFEYFNEVSKEIVYRGRRGVLWKAPFPSLYRKLFPAMRLVKQTIYPYRHADNRDVMFLFKKK